MMNDDPITNKKNKAVYIRGHTMGLKPGFFMLIHMAFPYIFFEI